MELKQRANQPAPTLTSTTTYTEIPITLAKKKEEVLQNSPDFWTKASFAMNLALFLIIVAILVFFVVAIICYRYKGKRTSEAGRVSC